jgi:hypothetical protein
MWRTLLLATLLAVAIAIVIAAVALWPHGVRVTVTNRGPEPLVDVVIYVAGNSYRLGTLEVGECQTVSVQAQGESNVELGFSYRSGEQFRRNAGGYFEASGYEGTIEVDLQAGEIVRNEHRISLWPSWL